MADTKLNIIVTAQDKASSSLKGITGALGSIGKFAAGAAVAGIGAAAAGVTALAGGITMLAKEAATLGPIKEAFAGINEAVGVGAEDMLKGLRDASGGLVTNTELMKTFNKAAQLVSVDFAQKLPDAMSSLGKVAASTGQDVGFLLDSLVTGVGRLSPMILDNLGIQVDLNKAYEDYAASIGIATGDLTKQQQQTALMNQVMTKLAENTANMPELSDPFKQLSVTMTNLKDDVATAIGPVVLPLIQQLADSISAFVSSDEFQAWIKEAVAWIRDNLIPAVQKIITFLSENLPPAIEFSASIFQNILLPAIKVIWEFIENYVIPAIQGLAKFFMEDLPAALENLRTAWEGNFGGIRSIVEGFFAHIKLLFDLFKAIWEGDWRRVGEITRQIVENIVMTVGNFFRGLWETIKNINWLELGKSIIIGIGEGIKAMGQWFLDTLLGVVGGAIDFVKGFLGIQSPSKVFYDFGKQMMVGWADGIKAFGDLPQGQMRLALQQVDAPQYSVSPVRSPAGAGGPTIQYINNGVSLGSQAEIVDTLVPLVQQASAKGQRRAGAKAQPKYQGRRGAM